MKNKLIAGLFISLTLCSTGVLACKTGKKRREDGLSGGGKKSKVKTRFLRPIEVYLTVALLAGFWACGNEREVSSPEGNFGQVKLMRPEPGVQAVTDIAALPILRYSSIAKQVSSHDKDGGNDDGSDGNSQLYIDEHGEYVVFDDYGPGCIYRMWFTAVLACIGEISIYVDDMEKPVVKCPFKSLFSSEQRPFNFPLTNFINESGGGYVTYIPICYEGRAKITLSVPPEYFNITYRRYDLDHSVSSFTGDEDYAPLFKQWNSPTKDPKPGVHVRTKTGTVTILAGGSEILMSEQGGGAIWNLYLDVVPFDLKAVSSSWLVTTWDGHQSADVEAPLNEFFGSYDPTLAPKGLLLGRDDEGRYYCHLPMPYWSSAKMMIENHGTKGVSVTYTVEILETAYPESSGYFTTQYHREDPTTQGRDYQFASIEGAGHYIGVTYTMTGPLDGSYLEGDERFYVDGSSSPAVYGTGTEDYFNGGRYSWLGPFSLPLHGIPSRLKWVGATRSSTECYRMNVGDLIPFFKSARLGIEHDADNSNVNDAHSTVAYFYRLPDPLLSLSDELDVSEPDSRQSHQYMTTDAKPTGVIASYYEGEEETVLVLGEGSMVGTESEFVMRIPSNNVGVLLRRRLDQLNGRQKALVLVDGAYAGVWYDVYENPFLRWSDSDFSIPSSLTVGKDLIHVRIENVGDVPWTEFSYKTYSYVVPPTL